MTVERWKLKVRGVPVSVARAVLAERCGRVHRAFQGQRFMESFVFRSDLLTGHEPSRTRTRSEDNCPQFRTPHPALRTRKVHGKRTPPNLDVSWDHEPEMHKSFKIKRPILRFMESYVFLSDLLTGHEPSSRWDRRHPCRRVARGLPRRQGCRRSQVHGKRTPPNLDVSWDHERWLRGGNACAG